MCSTCRLSCYHFQPIDLMLFNSGPGSTSCDQTQLINRPEDCLYPNYFRGNIPDIRHYYRQSGIHLWKIHSFHSMPHSAPPSAPVLTNWGQGVMTCETSFPATRFHMFFIVLVQLFTIFHRDNTTYLPGGLLTLQRPLLGARRCRRAAPHLLLHLVYFLEGHWADLLQSARFTGQQLCPNSNFRLASVPRQFDEHSS